MTVQYSFADLAELSAAIRKAEAQVDTLKGDIRSSAGQLQADWASSQASDSWNTVQTRWEGACGALHTALHQLAATVLANSDAMAQTEAANAGMFRGI